jgi:hypothetical protein
VNTGRAEKDYGVVTVTVSLFLCVLRERNFLLKSNALYSSVAYG